MAELNVRQARIATRFENTGKLDLFTRVTPVQEVLTLMGAVGGVLPIACLNLGNLMLARSAARKEQGAGVWCDNLRTPAFTVCPVLAEPARPDAAGIIARSITANIARPS